MGLSLFAVLLQDLKFRKIHVALLPVIFFSGVLLSHDYLTKQSLIINLVFFCLTFIIMYLYIVLKEQRLLNPFQRHFGLGDFLFYLSVTPIFEPKDYIMYFVGSLIFCLITMKIFSNDKHNNSIPLAGLASLFLIIILLIEQFSNNFNMTAI